MKTVLHNYHFDTRIPAEKEAWQELKARLKAMGLKCFETHGGGSHYMPRLGDSREIDLETKHLFDNQWNTAPIEGISEKGLRVFDWAKDYESHIGAPTGIKRGHWLEQTAEMKDARRNTMACGYCGKQEPAAKGYVFCPHCIDSEYLKESDLPLTRMRAVEETGNRAALTAAEADYLIPLYRDAQINGATERGKARIAAERRKIEADYNQTVANAKEKRDAARWVMDNVPGLIGNWIFYSHTLTHSFGWRTQLDSAVLEALLLKISEFPFHYEIKCADGRTLSN